MNTISIFWEGMPICGMLVEELYFHNKVEIYATKCSTDFDRDIFSDYGIEIIEIKRRLDLLRYYKKILNSKVFLSTGWSVENIFLFLILKLNKNLSIICVVDNIFNSTKKQKIAIFLKLGSYLDYFVDGYLVPGRLSFDYLKKINTRKKIYFRSYGASSKIFKMITPIYKRKNEFIYVGSLSKRKSTNVLLDAYAAYKKQGGTWSLKIIGNKLLGEEFTLEEILNLEDVEWLSFKQPRELNILMNQSKCFILPSMLDHWGTVLCEAASTGMILLGSVNAGATIDLIREGENGYSFIPDKVNIQGSMLKIQNADLTWQENASKLSQKIASKFDQYAYRRSVERIVSENTLNNLSVMQSYKY